MRTLKQVGNLNLYIFFANENMKETKTGQVLDISLLFRVIRYARPYKKQFIIAATAAIILSFLGPARPMLINYAIDNFIIISPVITLDWFSLSLIKSVLIFSILDLDKKATPL